MPLFPESLTLRDAELELRRLSVSDRAAILAACDDPEIVRWTALPDPFTPAEVDRYLRDADVRWQDGTVAELSVVRDGLMIGAVHLAFHEDWRASVAYWLARDARGRGLATRAVRLLVGWAFDATPELVRIELWSIVGNDASDAVARRAGFVEEGILRSRLPVRGSCRDVRCFSLLRDDVRPPAA